MEDILETRQRHFKPRRYLYEPPNWDSTDPVFEPEGRPNFQGSQLVVVKDDQVVDGSWTRYYTFDQPIPKIIGDRLVKSLTAESVVFEVRIVDDRLTLRLKLRYRLKIDAFHSSKFDQLVVEELSPIQLEMITKRQQKLLQSAS